MLSTAGVASLRRAAERLTRGRVSVNGHTITKLGTRADPEHDDIRVDGRRVRITHSRSTCCSTSPGATSRRDRITRTAIGRQPARVECLYPVGTSQLRLGRLLLLTNDGELAARLMHPRHEVGICVQRVRGEPDAAACAAGEGIVIDGRRTKPAKVRRLSSLNRHDWDHGSRGPVPAGSQDVKRSATRSCGCGAHFRSIIDLLLKVRVQPLRLRGCPAEGRADGHASEPELTRSTRERLPCPAPDPGARG